MVCPSLSVIVPMYNVAPYLPDFLESLSQQHLQDFECVLIDDGSTDETVEIAANWAATDDRFVLHRFENGGLGRARNRGLALSQGDFVAFADPDDLILEFGYARMLAALSHTDAVIATAPALQIFDGESPSQNSPRYWTTTGDMWDVDRAVAGVREEPRLVLDHTAWNKMYRRAELTAKEFRFPVDTTCEDVYPIISAYLEAATVHIVSEPVYAHRRRAASITSGILSDRVVFDWVRQTSSVLDEIEFSSPDVRTAYYKRMLRDEAWTRVSELDDALSRAASDAVAELASRMWTAAPITVRAALDAQRRLFYGLLTMGGRELLVDVRRVQSDSADQALHLQHRLRNELDGLRSELRIMEDDRDRLSSQRGLYWQGRTLVGRVLRSGAGPLRARR